MTMAMEMKVWNDKYFTYGQMSPFFDDKGNLLSNFIFDVIVMKKYMVYGIILDNILFVNG